MTNMNEFADVLPVHTGLKAGELTVYGTSWCGWTKKQRDYLNDKGMAYTFVDCDTEQCPSFASAYPTLNNNGAISVGYQEL
jgi:glutaredoxin